MCFVRIIKEMNQTSRKTKQLFIHYWCTFRFFLAYSDLRRLRTGWAACGIRALNTPFSTTLPWMEGSKSASCWSTSSRFWLWQETNAGVFRSILQLGMDTCRSAKCSFISSRLPSIRLIRPKKPHFISPPNTVTLPSSNYCCRSMLMHRLEMLDTKVHWISPVAWAMLPSVLWSPAIVLNLHSKQKWTLRRQRKTLLEQLGYCTLYTWRPDIPTSTAWGSSNPLGSTLTSSRKRARLYMSQRDSDRSSPSNTSWRRGSIRIYLTVAEWRHWMCWRKSKPKRSLIWRKSSKVEATGANAEGWSSRTCWRMATRRTRPLTLALIAVIWQRRNPTTTIVRMGQQVGVTRPKGISSGRNYPKRQMSFRDRNTVLILINTLQLNRLTVPQVESIDRPLSRLNSVFSMTRTTCTANPVSITSTTPEVWAEFLASQWRQIETLQTQSTGHGTAEWSTTRGFRNSPVHVLTWKRLSELEERFPRIWAAHKSAILERDPLHQGVG